MIDWDEARQGWDGTTPSLSGPVSGLKAGGLLSVKARAFWDTQSQGMKLAEASGTSGYDTTRASATGTVAVGIISMSTNGISPSPISRIELSPSTLQLDCFVIFSTIPT